MPTLGDLRTLNLSDFGLDPKGRRVRLRRIGDTILAEWGAEASQQLRGTLRAYKAALQMEVIGEDTVRVSLPGDDVREDNRVAYLASLVEFGMGPGGIGTEGPYDLRKFLLQSGTRSIRYDKNGKPYLNVPFQRSGDDIKTLGSVQALEAAKRLQATVSKKEAGDWRTIWGERMPAGHAQKLRPHHAADPLQDMVKMRSTYTRRGYGVTQQTSGYRIWRRASWNAAAPKWMTPGVKARRIGDTVAGRVGRLVLESL
jgi:hypothetical protein